MKPCSRVLIYLENTQQIVANKVETQNKHTQVGFFYTGSLCNEVHVFPMSFFTFIVTSKVLVNIWMQWNIALRSAFSRDGQKKLCLFVSLENFSIIWRRHHCHRRATNFDLCSAITAIEQWGFFKVPHPLWHGAFVYNGHLWGPVKHTPIAERLVVELSLPV